MSLAVDSSDELRGARPGNDEAVSEFLGASCLELRGSTCKVEDLDPALELFTKSNPSILDCDTSRFIPLG
jgi:hypothetical protein